MTGIWVTMGYISYSTLYSPTISLQYSKKLPSGEPTSIFCLSLPCSHTANLFKKQNIHEWPEN